MTFPAEAGFSHWGHPPRKNAAKLRFFFDVCNFLSNKSDFLTKKGVLNGIRFTHKMFNF